MKSMLRCGLSMTLSLVSLVRHPGMKHLLLRKSLDYQRNLYRNYSTNSDRLSFNTENTMATDLNRGSLLVKEATWIIPKAVMKIQVENNKGGSGAIIPNPTHLPLFNPDPLPPNKPITLTEPFT